MWDFIRQKLYKNWEDKYGDDYHLPKSILDIKLDLSKSYTVNKNILLKSITHETYKYKKKRGNYYKSYGGVWIIYSEKNGKKVYYDVAETNEILSEMINFMKYLSLGKRDVRKNIYKNYKKKVYTRYKAQQIYKALGRNKTIYFSILTQCDERDKRLHDEINIACKTKAMWWSPSTKQNNMLKSMNLLFSDD